MFDVIAGYAVQILRKHVSCTAFPVFVRNYFGLIVNVLYHLLTPPNTTANNTFIVEQSIPLQTLTDPEGSRRLRLPDFKTLGT
jgi:hypothetical protein